MFAFLVGRQVIEGDPRDVDPPSDDEGESQPRVAVTNRANKLMMQLRRRKGLQTEEQVVVHAEKQRTLNKKK